MARNILLIHDDPAIAAFMTNSLSGSTQGLFRVDWVRTYAEARERLVGGVRQQREQKSGIAAIVVDLFLPDCKGIATFELLFREAPHIPILVVSTERDEPVAKLALQGGAQDYILSTRLDDYLLPKTLRSMIERAETAEALFEEKERAEVTLNSIGDGVISTDLSGRVTFLNVVAEDMTGWLRAEAIGQRFEDVFQLVHRLSGETLPNPMALAIREDKAVGLTPDSMLMRRDGAEAPIEDSAAPIHDRRGGVTGAVMVFHDVSKARALSLRMSYLAQHDSLTDLPNRILFRDRLSQAIAHAHRDQNKLAVLFLDIDRFKHINDSLGHAAGDRLLQSVASRLLGCVRASDTVSRQGGDEFVILLCDIAHEEAAAAIADKVLLEVSLPHRLDESGHDVHVTASVGIATYPTDGVNADRLMKNADAAMYHAKESGRANYQFFAPEMNARATERHFLESGLRMAIPRGELVLRYQPKMDLTTGAIIGVEALLRWQHGNGDSVPPTRFIPVAEDSGLIVPIGRWVLREACTQARSWQDEGLSLARVAINISAVELRAKHFVTGVRDILAETNLSPSHLELELTETFLMQDPKSTASVLIALKDMGINLALDDFGTGYSSLSYLKRFPIDTLKIDQSFVRDLTSDADDASIVSAVISMGESLDMIVVAEGVETLPQLKFLQDHACPEGQGFYFSRPVTAPDFARLLRGDVEMEPALA